MNQEQALNKMRLGKNIFLTGGAGTGKTYLINKYIKESEEKGLKVLRTASTGIAALNLSTEDENGANIGKTLHQAFGIPIPCYGKALKDIKLAKVPKETKEADIIVIDEISMCRNDVFAYFYILLDKIQKQYLKTIQVIVIGDFYQLPPVVPETEKAQLKKFGLDSSGYCFYTPEWNKMKFVFCEIDEIYRQEDKEFILNLKKLREGDKSCISFFNKKFTTDLPNDCLTICSTNAEASRINNECLEAIDGPKCAYSGEKTGRTAKEYSVEETIFLKPSAKVIFMVNDHINNNYQNGSIGEVVECFDNYVIVKINDMEIPVFPYEWKAYSISIYNGMTTKKSIGSFSQLPLKLAYAITMHKTQGQTYEKAIINPDSFADGQLYVALSRIKSLDGLYLSDFIEEDYIKVNSLVKEFYINKKMDIPEWIIKKKKEIELKQNKAPVKRKTTAKTAVKKKPVSKKSTVKNKTTTSKTKKVVSKPKKITTKNKKAVVSKKKI